MVTSSYENCLPLRVWLFVPMLVEVGKNPIPTIKGKEVNSPIRRCMSDHILLYKCSISTYKEWSHPQSHKKDKLGICLHPHLLRQ